MLSRIAGRSITSISTKFHGSDRVSAAASASFLQSCTNFYTPTSNPQQLYNYYSTTIPTQSQQPSTAQLVKQLREATGAPMMECKKALGDSEVNNNIELAKEWLRKHGTAKASSKVAGREANEGMIGISITKQTNPVEGLLPVASLVKVSSETDFASRSEIFSTFVQDVATCASNFPSGLLSGSGISDDIPNFLSSSVKHVEDINTLEDLQVLDNEESDKTLADLQNDAILAIRENIAVDSIDIIRATSPTSTLGGYVHGKPTSDVSCGSAASIVRLEVVDESKAKPKEVQEETAKKLAMHIVAAKPTYLNPSSVPSDILAKEKEILMENMKDSNKPPEILEKIITGQLRKYYEGVCLTEQTHLVEGDGNVKVGKVLKDVGLEVAEFKLMSMK